jgi:predicted RNase H-like HicB family nuclease
MAHRQTMSFRVVLEREADGRYSVYCPALPGCASQGDSETEALENIREAIELYVEACEQEGRPLPLTDVEFRDVEIAV